jgi:hypothetical protein
VRVLPIQKLFDARGMSVLGSHVKCCIPALYGHPYAALSRRSGSFACEDERGGVRVRVRVRVRRVRVRVRIRVRVRAHPDP